MTVEVTKLPNGLTVASDSMPGVESLSLGAWVDVGTRHEPAEVNGIAHLLEHMAFKGTDRRDAYAIAQEIEAVGGQVNAYTSREHTAYYTRVLAEDTPLALDILSDILQHSTFDNEELRRERAVVLQEIGQAFDTPDDIIFDFFQETAYPDQALGRPVLGQPEIVERLGRETLKGYMERNYDSGSMILAAAGKLNHSALVELASEAFTELRPDSAKRAEIARYRGGDFRQNRDLEQVHMVLGFESLGYLDPDHYGLTLLSTLLGGGMSSRLFQEVREKRGLVYSIYSFNSAYRDGGTFGIYAGTGEAEVGEVIPVVCDELTKLSQSVSQEELDRARAQVKASLLMSRESCSARCEQLAQQILCYDRPLTTAEILEKIAAVTPQDIERLGARLISSRPTFTVTGPIGRVEAYDSLCARLA